jgi:hypothetical protein
MPLNVLKRTFMTASLCLLPGLFIGLLLAFPQAVMAADGDLYQGRANVADQSAGEQGKATQAALLQVLGKLSGLGSFATYPEVTGALSGASSMLLAFYYENHPVLQPDGSSIDQLQLVANFSPKAVDELRGQLQLPRWKPEREPLRVWPIVDDGVDRIIMPIELEYAWASVADVAVSRGMPLRWPEPDENGAYAADVQVLWDGYAGESSDSPQAESLADTLVIAAVHDGPEWNVRMSMDYEGLRWSEQIRGMDLQVVLQQGMSQVIDQIVGASSIAAADTGEWVAELIVTQISNADEYARCVSYLQGLSVVESLRVKSVEAGRVNFLLTLNAAPNYLQQFITSGRTLAPGAVEGEYQLQP